MPVKSLACQPVMFDGVLTWQMFPLSCLVSGIRICATRPAGRVGHTVLRVGGQQPDQSASALGKQARPQLISCMTAPVGMVHVSDVGKMLLMR